MNYFKSYLFCISQLSSLCLLLFYATLLDATRRYSTLLGATRRYSELLYAYSYLLLFLLSWKVRFKISANCDCLWAAMVILHCILAWHERDNRVRGLTLLTKYMENFPWNCVSSSQGFCSRSFFLVVVFLTLFTSHSDMQVGTTAEKTMGSLEVENQVFYLLEILFL
jgi:hypothetical protein